MNDILKRIRRLMMVAVCAVLLVACGGMETDAPALTTGDSDDEQQQEEADQEQITYPFEETEQDEETDQEEVELGEVDDGVVDDEHRCVEICLKAMWCQEEGSELAECVEQCENAEDTGIAKDTVLTCIEDANSCRDVRRCEDQIEPCHEICGVYDLCGYFHEGVGCHSWCAGEIWAGRLDWEAQGCVVAAGADFECPDDLAMCGLYHADH